MDKLMQFVKKTEPNKSRKRPVIKSKWKREVEREKRYKAAGFPQFPSCNHNQNAFKCKQLTMQMIRKFYEKFYKCTNKITQDNFILKFCSVQGAKRMKNSSKRTKTIKYYILGDKGAKVPVCQKTFMGTLLVKKDRIQGVLKRFYENGGQMPQENRGGDRKSERFTIRKLSVQRFIESFKGQESHYCRSKIMNRVYLSSELNIRKMWRMYNQSHEPDLQVKQHFFRKIFNRYYNIGFGTPRTDVCSTCTEIGEKLKSETDTTKKKQLLY